jgi:hypothetical protein
MLTHIWLTPPLAFARVGSSPVPSAAYMWSASDLAPNGSGRTTLAAAETLDLDENGKISRSEPDRIVFRDRYGIRPVCPYFELHGTWTHDGRKHSGQITRAVLASQRIDISDISWDIHVAQLKAFHYTYDNGDRIDALLHLSGTDTKRHPLEGRSPSNAKQPLVPKDGFVPLGAVQVAAPSRAFPEIRLRFYAPAGLVYAPSNFAGRIRDADFRLAGNREWRALKIPKERRFLNPKATWAKYILERSTLGPWSGTDSRNIPALLFAYLEVGPNEDIADHHGLGLVDDVSDGIITCTVKLGRRKLAAQARIVVGPPDYGPASRPPVSLADSLADRTDREQPRTGRWTMDELRDIVHDIFERAFETSDQMNKDYQNSRCHEENTTTLNDLSMTSAYDREDVEAMLWPDVTANPAAVRRGDADALALAKTGERKHRRYSAVEYLEERFRENPELFEQWIRRPLDPNPYFDRRMPALMRGSDTRPWHLTRRQWEIVRLWVDELKKDAPKRAAKPGS